MDYLTNDTDIKKVADAIRAKGGTSAQLVYPAGFVSAIQAIPSGSGSDDVLNSILDRSIAGEYENNTAEKIGKYAFYACEKLTKVIISAAKSVETGAFYNCYTLNTIDAPDVTSIGQNAFMSCWGLQEAEFPALKTVGTGAFHTSGLTSVNFPLVTAIPGSAFASCDALTKADFASATSIASQAFERDSALVTVILRGSSVATLANVRAFSGTPVTDGTGYIYVPSALVDSYKAATNWAAYANQIRAIEDYPDITGGAA